MPDDSPLRASDHDREDVARRLAHHLAAGRLDLTEYDQRVAAAYAAITVDELAPLLRDLPTDALTREPDGTTPLPVPRGWASWALTTAICLTIWVGSSIGTQDIQNFWPFWVVGPWGAVLLAQRVRPVRASRCA